MALPTESTLLAEFTYELRPVERGYANRTLYVNLDTNTIYEKPVTQQMKDLFTGGRGFCLKLLWDAVNPETKWNDPQNELVIANGPICRITAYPGSGKATIVALSPLTGNVRGPPGRASVLLLEGRFTRPEGFWKPFGSFGASRYIQSRHDVIPAYIYSVTGS